MKTITQYFTTPKAITNFQLEENRSENYNNENLKIEISEQINSNESSILPVNKITKFNNKQQTSKKENLCMNNSNAVESNGDLNVISEKRNRKMRSLSKNNLTIKHCESIVKNRNGNNQDTCQIMQGNKANLHKISVKQTSVKRKLMSSEESGSIKKQKCENEKITCENPDNHDKRQFTNNEFPSFDKSDLVENKLNFVKKNRKHKAHAELLGSKSISSKKNNKNKLMYKNKRIKSKISLSNNELTQKDSELDSSLELFETDSNSESINRSLIFEMTSRSVGNLKEDKSQNKASLFNYFNKVNKDIAFNSNQSNKIKVEALIHYPPATLQKLSMVKSPKRLSLSEKRLSPKGTFQDTPLDIIEILDSDSKEILNSNISLSTINSHNLTIICDNNKTPNKTCRIEQSSAQKTPDTITVKENRLLKTPGSDSKSWTMRVRLSSPCVMVSNEDSNDSSSNESQIKQNVDVSESEMLITSRVKSVNKKSNSKNDTTGVIILDEDSNSTTSIESQNDKILIDGSGPSTSKPSDKLYSLFKKREKTTKVFKDPIQQEAKLRFLQSEIPETIKRKVVISNRSSTSTMPAPFPLISHVQQHTENDKYKGHNLNFYISPVISEEVFKPKSSHPISIKDEPNLLNLLTVFTPPANIKGYLKTLQDQATEDFIIRKVYENLRKKKKRLGNSFDVWTEVYKPEVVSDIIGNSENIEKLKNWLQSQKCSRKTEDDLSSGDEFIDSDSEMEKKHNLNNVAILTGPYGCGKTSTIYALAKELGFEVLEINSSCNRTGKWLLSEFSESTQSHNLDLSQSMMDLFNSGFRKNQKQKKTIIKQNESSNAKTSLLLVEDADVLFMDHDEGYISAIITLLSTSKRPVILTVNNQKCDLISKFESSKQLLLKFNRPRTLKLELWLRLVALVEGVELPAEYATRLVNSSKADVRHCLLQLQFLVQSKLIQWKKEWSLSSLWWNWPAKYNLKFSVPTLDSIAVSEDAEVYDKTHLMRSINSIAKLTEHLAFIDILCPIRFENEFENPCPKTWEMYWIESTNLSDRDHFIDGKTTKSTDLCNWLEQNLINEQEKNILRFYTTYEKRWCSLLKKANDMFLPAVSTSYQCCHDNVSSDYFPSLRTMGRAEKSRLANYTRRANRQFCYLKGLGIHANEFLKKFMCDSF